MKKGQEKAFQVGKTAYARILWLEGAWREKAESRGEGGSWGRDGQELDHTDLREESPLDPRMEEKPESPQLQESGGEGNDQFIFRRTFSGPKAQQRTWHTVVLSKCLLTMTSQERG